MNHHYFLPERRRASGWGAALLAALLCAAPALAGSDSPDAPGSGQGPSGSGGSGGGFSAGDETVGTLPALQDEPSLPGWLLPGDRLVLEGSVPAVQGALRLARGHGLVRLEALDEAGTRVRATFLGDWRLVLRPAELAGGELSLALEILTAETTAWVGARARAPRTAVLGPGDLALPIASLAERGLLDSSPFALHTRNALGVVTSLVARERQGIVTLELRTF
jgi:hypothetical protein